MGLRGYWGQKNRARRGVEDLGGCVNGPGLGMSPLPSHLNVQGLSCGLGGGG